MGSVFHIGSISSRSSVNCRWQIAFGPNWSNPAGVHCDSLFQLRDAQIAKGEPMKSHILALSCFILTLAPALLAQSAGTSALTGTVTDPTGAVIPNVTV